ncbi:MAG: lysine exporter LysO family protein [Clostridiales bacterium]|nr:lysine exporter LysO family protein [Clostridiales bacterium]MDD7035583.1 lysine exporter LysO family protein [Bacillota bacterium]MDY2919832.1 lysine exporter LysO family protein [Lentihominibacter sp.]
MTTLLLYLGITVIGYFLGSFCRKKNRRIPLVGTMQTLAIMILVFVMGARIGGNEEVVSQLDTIGLLALATALIILATTVAAMFLGRKLLGFNRYGLRKGEVAEEDEHDGKAGGMNRMTFIIVGCVALGIAAGYFVMPSGFMDISGNLMTLFLCILLIFVGIDIGTEGTLGPNFKAAGWRVIVFPFINMAGMLIGAFICGLILPLGMQDAFCVGAGFSWYSLAPAMLASYSTKVSAISFMHNVIREIVSILLIPVVARRVGYIECFSMPGAASMDVCLPVVEKATRGDIAVYSFINGAVLSAAVPVFVSFFMNL